MRICEYSLSDTMSHYHFGWALLHCSQEPCELNDSAWQLICINSLDTDRLVGSFFCTLRIASVQMSEAVAKHCSQVHMYSFSTGLTFTDTVYDANVDSIGCSVLYLPLESSQGLTRKKEMFCLKTPIYVSKPAHNSWTWNYDRPALYLPHPIIFEDDHGT